MFNLTNTGKPKKAARDIWKYHLRFPNGCLARNHAALAPIITMNADGKDFTSNVTGIQTQTVNVIFSLEDP